MQIDQTLPPQNILCSHSKQTQQQNSEPNIPKDQEGSKEEKWHPILASIEEHKHLLGKPDKVLISAVRLGVPDSLREQVWPRLVQPPPVSYQQCRGSSNAEKDIDLDLERTFPYHKQAKQIGARMREVLNALANALPELGYCQGMNFIVGVLLMKLSDEDAFKVAYYILVHQRHRFLLQNLNLIHQKVYALEKITKRFYPKLNRQFQELNLQSLLYASSWFITLFCSNLPTSYTFRIIECYLLEGEKILYRVALQIMKLKKKSIKHFKKLQEVVDEIKDFSGFNEANVDQFFAEMFQLKLSREDIDFYCREFNKKFPSS